MGDRVYIRPLKQKDALVSWKWRNDPAVWNYTGSKPDKPITPEIELDWIKRVLLIKEERRFAICETESNEYIGNVQLTDIKPYDAQFHIFIGNKEKWNKGFGTEATQKIIKYGFTELNLQCIYLDVDKTNIAAIRSYEKIGFTVMCELDTSIRMAIFRTDNSKKMLSVFVMTFNHGSFIKQMLDGVFAQLVNFNFDIVVGDDFSNDNTRKILLDYSAKFPDKLKLLFYPRNISATYNQINCFRNCKGKYIALCEGDDYWLDENKLITQVNFLEKNDDYAICFHRVYEMTNDKIVISNLNDSEAEQTYTIEDLSKKNFIHTPSVVFRNNLFDNFPVWFPDSPVGDYVLHMLNSKHGKIKYFPCPMAVYRIHRGGVWSQQNIILTRKKWNKVLDYMITENFPDSVMKNLKQQKVEQLVANLKDLFFVDQTGFKIELKKFIDEHPELSYEWLTVYYPQLISILRERILNSKEFKVGYTIIRPLKKIKNLFWSNR